MKKEPKKLSSEAVIKANINNLVETLYNTSTIDGKWELFLRDAGLDDDNNEYVCVGAIGMAVGALGRVNYLSLHQVTVVRNAVERLLQMRNKDGSWSSLWKEGEVSRGVVFDTVCCLRALLSVGFLDHESMLLDKRNNELYDNIHFVLGSVRWLYSMRVINEMHDDEYGWGYCENIRDSIAIMPTTEVLSLLKEIYYKIMMNQPDCIGNKEFDIDENVSLLEMINTVSKLLYGMKDSVGMWGKSRQDQGRLLYSCLAMSVLLKFSKEYDEIHTKTGKVVPEQLLVDKDMENFERLLLKAYYNKEFEISYLSMIDTKEVFDTYVQESFDENGKIIKSIIDHENSYEVVVINAITEFVCFYSRLSGRCKIIMYNILCKLNNFLESRMTTINGRFALQSRRGLYSQSFPIYAITETLEMWKNVLEKGDTIRRLTSIKGKYQSLLFSFVQLALVFGANFVMNPEMSIFKVVFISLILFTSDIVKEKIVLKSDHYA